MRQETNIFRVKGFLILIAVLSLVLFMKTDTKKHLERILNEFKKIKEVIAIYIFGSYAKGTQTLRSDVDVCVVTEENIPEDVESELGSTYSDDIDLSLLKNFPLHMKFRVFKEGKEIYVRDEQKLARIKFRVIKEYLDYEPVLAKLSSSVLASR